MHKSSIQYRADLKYRRMTVSRQVFPIRQKIDVAKQKPRHDGGLTLANLHLHEAC